MKDGSRKPAGGTFWKYISPEYRYAMERYERRRAGEVQDKRERRLTERDSRQLVHNRGLRAGRGGYAPGATMAAGASVGPGTGLLR